MKNTGVSTPVARCGVETLFDGVAKFRASFAKRLAGLGQTEQTLKAATRR